MTRIREWQFIIFIHMDVSILDSTFNSNLPQ